MSKFQVPASKASIGQNRFEFEFGDKTYSIPKLQYLKPSLMKQLNGQDAEMLVLGLVDEYYPAIPAEPAVEAVEATESTPAVEARPAVAGRPALSDEFASLDQLLALYEAWAEASGLTVGESSGSGGSSKSTAEPSTETSSSSADLLAQETTTATSAPSVSAG